jgi:hypothetical protein
MKFQKGQKYELNQSQKDYYDSIDDGKGNPCIGYHYALAVNTGDYYICDCWIVSKSGAVHPGLNNSPVPVNRDSIALR